MRFSRTVWLLAWISLFTDVASEMLYPIMPLYLQSIGFTVVWIGVLEGFAEAIAGLSKGYFGRLSDTMQQRKSFVQGGYALSALAKPLMAASVLPVWVFAIRTLERLGKGIRSAPRDAMLAAETNAHNKGAVFGFHRSMDTTGAALGPLLALGFLYYSPGNYQSLFLLAFLPGLLAMGLTMALPRENPKVAVSASPQGNNPAVYFFDFLLYLRRGTAAYKQLVAGLLAFALINSSDAFLLLQLKQAGWDDLSIIGVYIGYNVGYALLAFPVGMWADRWGFKTSWIVGLCAFSLAYFLLAGYAGQVAWVIVAFVCYALYTATTEGISKAWISRLVSPAETATALGTYTALQSVAAFLASTLTGWVWYYAGGATALGLIA
ncbi:MAG TPA: MFS transporter, partial [Microscillaceae bacterium]|nr:MFS transporter [Microscillaceae bacterium]